MLVLDGTDINACVGVVREPTATTQTKRGTSEAGKDIILFLLLFDELAESATIIFAAIQLAWSEKVSQREEKMASIRHTRKVLDVHLDKEN